MVNTIKKIVILIYICTVLFSSAVASDTVSTGKENYIPTPDSLLTSDFETVKPLSYPLGKSILLSTVIPGGGHFLCNKKLRGSLYLASDLILAMTTVGRYSEYSSSFSQYETSLERVGNLADSVEKYDSNIDLYNTYSDSLITSIVDADIAHFNVVQAKYVYQHLLGWTVAVYGMNILDVMKQSNYFYSEKSRNPKIAGWLSAIPVLGLGQIYNGSFQKTGIIFSTHLLLALTAYHKNILADYSLKKKIEVENTKSLSESVKNDRINRWTGSYDQNIRDRNMYLWYFVIFYFYGIFDAVVDAHLHDSNRKLKILPKVSFTENTVAGITMNLKF